MGKSTNRPVVLNMKVFLRAAIVLVFSFLVALVAATFLREMLNGAYIATQSAVARDLFYFLSLNRYTVVLVGCIFMLLLFSNWILRPAFDSLSSMIKDSIHTGEGTPPPVRLPRDFKGLETALNQVNHDLQLWRYVVKESEQRKDDLVVYLAHDIRTPLTSVLGYLDLLHENPDLHPEQRRRFTEIALRKARRMQLLVDELFDVTRFKIGQIELERTSINIHMMMNQLLEEMRPVLSQRDITYEIIDNGIGFVFIDAEKMARALDNILHNAAHYALDNGKITVCLGCSTNGRKLVEISNTGADISQEKLDRFFEKFYRGDEARSSETGGSGLGLAIARNIVEAHGGNIYAKSQNQVTTFSITLPA